MGLMHDLFGGGGGGKKKKGRRRSAWIEDGGHYHLNRAKRRARHLREHGYHTRISTLPNGKHVVFKKHKR